MIEDQLTRDERIRLEALNQAVQSSHLANPTANQVVVRASFFESYVRGELLSPATGGRRPADGQN